VIIASSEGGVDIEEIARKSPEKITRIHIDPLLGLRNYQVVDLATSIDLPREHWRAFREVCQGLWRAYIDYDANLAEINPLVITMISVYCAGWENGGMIMPVPPSDLSDMPILTWRTHRIEARKNGLSYIKLDGPLSCMVNAPGGNGHHGYHQVVWW
jgi:succinyl-CoA synthetase beta subunit